jgi:hypothetical protein
MNMPLFSPNRVRVVGVAIVLAAAASLPVASASADTSSTALQATAQTTSAVGAHVVPLFAAPRMAK